MEEDRDTEHGILETIMSPPPESFHSNGSYELFSPSSEASFSTTQTLFHDGLSNLHHHAANFQQPAAAVAAILMASPGTPFHMINTTMNASYGIQALISGIHTGSGGGGASGGLVVDHHDQQSGSNFYDMRLPNLASELEIRREWNRKNILEIKERQIRSKAQQELILEQAAKERECFYTERAAQLQATKIINREKERLFRAHMQSSQNCNSDEGNNTWEAVAALIGLDLEDQVVVSNSSSSSSKKLQDVKIAELLNSKLGTDPNSPIGIIMAARDLDGRRLKDPPPTPSKATDLSRFKEILMKLRHQPLVR
ncbi:unnamed protein product [Sphagnum compactum]